MALHPIRYDSVGLLRRACEPGKMGFFQTTRGLCGSFRVDQRVGGQIDFQGAGVLLCVGGSVAYHRWRPDHSIWQECVNILLAAGPQENDRFLFLRNPKNINAGQYIERSIQEACNGN
jgi:hypothetical protein